MTKKYYAFFLNENNYGIVDTWDECKSITQGQKARYKSFKTYKEAQEWLNLGANYQDKELSKKNLLKDFSKYSIFFDAGTGRGNGVEVRITNREKTSLISDVISENLKNNFKKKNWFINEFGNLQLDKKRTNNFGELLALYLAICYAMEYNIDKIYGDSKLVLDYWSKGFYNKDNLENETILLIEEVAKKRKKFEALNGEISFIPGDINPADLGFHK